MKLKEFKTTSKVLQHFIDKYCRPLEKAGCVLDLHICSKEEDEALIHCYGVLEHVMIHDVKSEQLLMSVWFGRGGIMNRPDHIEAGYSINGTLDQNLRIENPVYFPTSYVSKDEIDKWIKRVLRKQLKNMTKEE